MSSEYQSAHDDAMGTVCLREENETDRFHTVFPDHYTAENLHILLRCTHLVLDSYTLVQRFHPRIQFDVVFRHRVFRQLASCRFANPCSTADCRVCAWHLRQSRLRQGIVIAWVYPCFHFFVNIVWNLSCRNAVSCGSLCRCGRSKPD
jgi:hypothetical protein